MRSPQTRPLTVALAVAVLVAALEYNGVFSTWQWKLTDALYVGHPPPPDIVIVAIDDRSIQALGRWPWPRRIHAQIVRALSAAKPAAIGYDVNFPEPSGSDADDAALEQALGDSGLVVLPFEATLDLSASPPVARDSLYPLPRFLTSSTLGVSNTPPDPDGVLRRIPREAALPDGSRRPAFFFAVLARAGMREAGPLGPELLVHFAGPSGAVPTVSAQDVLAGTVPSDRFAGKIVLVGATAPDLHDAVLTPTAKRIPMNGVEVHANAIASARAGGLAEEPAAASAATGALFALAAAFAAERFRRIRNVLAILLALGAGYLLAAFLLFDAKVILSILYPLLALLLAGSAATLTRLSREKREKGQIRATLTRYVSPQVVEFLIAHPEKLALGGEKREMSVLFSDLRGFTSLSERMSPEQLVAVLNRYLSEMTAIVFEGGGVLDKYMGDAVMAFWNAPIDDAAHAEHAVRAALRMRDRLHEMNAEGAFPEGVTLRLGVGVNTGPMVVGNMGGKERFDYTVMGDAVNLGSRLEGLNKEYGTEVIVSETAAAALGGSMLLRPLDLVAVKGKKEPVLIFEAVGLRAEAGAETLSFVEAFAAARALYRGRRFAEAERAFAALTERRPDDGPTKTYLERAAYFLAHPPAQDWDGVWVMTKK